MLCAAQEKRAVPIGIPFENGQHKNKPLEVMQCKYLYHRAMRLLRALDAAANVRKVRDRVLVSAETRRDHLYCVLDDHALRPGMSPLFEDGVSFYTFFETRDEALLRVLVFGCQQQAEQIQAFRFSPEQLAEFNARRVLVCFADPVSFSMHHVHATAYA